MQEEYTARMTSLSHAAYEAATQPGLSPREAAERLLEAAPIRSFPEILCAFSPEEGLRERLVDGLCRNDERRGRASVDKKVRGWLAGRYRPTAREDLLELCFVLRLNLEDADAFLTMTGEEGLHWRDPRELVYAFALRRGESYPEARELLERLSPEFAPENVSREPESFTPTARREIAQCDTEEELKGYLRRAAGKLGSLHNGAYLQATAMLRLLEKPYSFPGKDERTYTVREIVEKYLDRRLPSVREGKELDEKRRRILADWPDEVALSRMKNRKTDVSRKTLVLLFLATDGAEEDEEDDDWYEERTEAQEADAAFRSSCLRMNQMLAGCGFGMLDPRNPFDWIALYCMRVQEESAGMDGLNERLTKVLDALFPTETPEE